jgi:hypothetical protein
MFLVPIAFNDLRAGIWYVCRMYDGNRITREFYVRPHGGFDGHGQLSVDTLPITEDLNALPPDYFFRTSRAHGGPGVRYFRILPTARGSPRNKSKRFRGSPSSNTMTVGRKRKRFLRTKPRMFTRRLVPQ